jgi:hypothetical protein
MGISMKKFAQPKHTSDQHDPFEYMIQIYSADGRLLGESLINAREHRIANIEDAEEYARECMAISRFESSIVIVSSEVADSLDQVHIKVVANDAN